MKSNSEKFEKIWSLIKYIEFHSGNIEKSRAELKSSEAKLLEKEQALIELLEAYLPDEEAKIEQE